MGGYTMMGNRQINTHLRAFDKVRRDWIMILSENPGHSEAAHYIISINAKMELLRNFWNWNDESVEMEVVR